MPRLKPIIFVKTSINDEYLLGKKCCKNSHPKDIDNPIIRTMDTV